MEDGYHPVSGIFQSVSLGDTIRIETTRAEGELVIVGIEACRPEDTTVAKAVMAWRKKTGIIAGLRVEVTKHIPAMGGMGGGSADAAATLAALEDLFGCASSLPELAALASKIGADVPFFLHGGAAFVSGIGDIIQPIKARTDFGILAVEPGFGISTAEAYAALDRSRLETGFKPSASKSCAEWESAYLEDISSWRFSNSFEPMLGGLHPEYASLRERLIETGARFVAITGSGSTMYGVYDGPGRARAAARDFTANMGGPGAGGMPASLRLHALEPLETSIVLR